MKLLGASLALAGIEGCTRMPASNILPYVDQPELTPGLPQYYATSMVIDGYATGLLVESHEGRPTKVEGHPDHPASLGAAGVLEQASVLQLYDPHRGRRVRRGQQVARWNDLAALLSPERLRSQLGAGGAGLFLLLEPTSSPLEAELLDRVLNLYPAARVHFYAPLAASNDLFVPQYDFREADVVVAVDADFLAAGPFHLRHARQFAERRVPESAGRGMNRCYAIESSVTTTGTAADHRLRIRQAEIVPVLRRLLAAVNGDSVADVSGVDARWIDALARDLRAHSGRGVLVGGEYLSAGAKALVMQVNERLANIGRTVWFTRSPLVSAGDARSSFPPLLEALRAGNVEVLVCAGGNPSYAAAGTSDVSTLLRRARQSVYLGLYENETARDCEWFVPAAHFLESWGDARAYDGTLSIVQPLIEPLFGAKTPAQLLSLLLGVADAHAHDLVRQSWQTRGNVGGASDFEDGWRAALTRGFVEASAFPREQTLPAATPVIGAAASSTTGVELVFRPHSRIRDGAFANNGWLQELPDPVTTLTWDNAAQVSPATAQRLSLITGDLMDIQVGGRHIQIPALVVAGHADDALTLHFGYGRDGAEAVAHGVGVNVYPIWPGDTYSVTGATVSRMSGRPRRELAITQPHRTLETSAAARVMTANDFATGQPLSRPRMLTLYQPPVSQPDAPVPHQWAMTIDLGACIGCGACMVACQAENNVPVVGREEVLVGREMHWLRIDWYTPPTVEPVAIPQPMLCQHCEKAPCEYVCPVEATVHSRDGLNEMIYNRCVGTRFCSNNCPYKVRRFNWSDFNAGLEEVERLARNPDVTIRERGVMEKCTFCVQRIREAEIAARVDDRPLRGTDVRTACQQACPTQAIAFGSLNDDDSPMIRARAGKRTYAVLDELGTEPRVRYLARVRNPNPELEPAS